MQTRQSSLRIPHPLSDTVILSIPPPTISILIEFAPASRAFSMSSFTIDAGFSTTSPAEINEIKSSLRTWILPN